MPVTGSVLDAWRRLSAEAVQVLAAVREAVSSLHANSGCGLDAARPAEDSAVRSMHIQPGWRETQTAAASTHWWQGVGNRLLVDELALIPSAGREELAPILLQLGRGFGQCHLNTQSLFAKATGVLVEPELQQGCKPPATPVLKLHKPAIPATHRRTTDAGSMQ